MAAKSSYLSLWVGSAQERSKGRRLHLTQWVIVLRKPANYSKSKALLIEVSEGIGRLLRDIYTAAHESAESTLPWFQLSWLLARAKVPMAKSPLLYVSPRHRCRARCLQYPSPAGRSVYVAVATDKVYTLHISPERNAIPISIERQFLKLLHMQRLCILRQS
ncbi:hypothetical protein EJ04DRAFT_588129, partial [Polyplosphaeria fusca]